MTAPRAVTVPDRETPAGALTVRPHYFDPLRYVVAVEWGDDDAGGAAAVALDATDVTAVRDALTAWLDAQARAAVPASRPGFSS
jgi:hypothetical protein